MRDFKILDTTLRDGSYVINFQFSAAETRQIAAELQRAGIELIEIGHGIGLGATAKGLGVARETDLSYMEAAAEVVNESLWGMFCIPGIASLADLDAAIDHSMPFVRLGVPVENVKALGPFVEKAKKAGMFVAANFMKSYVKPPTEFAKVAQEAAATGVDIIYVVDSAGNMTPNDTTAYIKATKDAVDTQIGFHAHNNLGLANANAFAAVEAGCSIIDSSLQGMGRCTGNTITEQFVAIAQRSKWNTKYDLFALMDASDSLVRPRLTQVGHDSVDLICGFAGFHSSYMDVIRDVAIKYDIDPRQLIIDVCAVNQSEAPLALVDSIGAQLADKNHATGYRHRFPLRHYFGHEQSALEDDE